MQQQQHTPKTYAKPVDFDQLYPGRFIKAGELLGRKVTLTITDVELEGLLGEDGKEKAKAIVRFKESEKALVTCKTNGICIKEMFGKAIADWIGKRITIFPDTWNGEPCIRIWGSPDIARDMDVQVTLPRRRPFNKTMHKMPARGEAPKAADPGDSELATVDELRGKLNAANDVDALNDAYDLVREIRDEDARVALQALYQDRLADLEPVL